MKKQILGLVLGSVLVGTSFAGTTVAVVDLTQVFQQVPQGSAAFNALKQQLAPQVAQLQTQQTNLQNNKSLSKAAMSAQTNTLQQSIQNFQQMASQKEQDLLTVFGNDVKAVVAQIAQKNDYDLVLSNQTTLYSTDEVNITNQVITMLQQEASNNNPS